MFRPFHFRIPTKSNKVPTGSDWLHEVKYDGYRLRLERDRDRVRLITRGGHNWTDRYPWIVEATRKVRQKRFVLDGEAVVLGVDGVDGVADFNALHSRKHDHEVQFCDSICSPRAATICAACRSQCGRPTLIGYWRGGRKASSSIRLSAAR
jgi:ATP-dependent DNA ligase